MQEKPTLKEKVAIIAFAALANGVFFGLLFVLEERWFKFMVWTGFVFGIIVYACAHDLKRIRALMVFGVLLTIHVAVCLAYLRSENEFPSLLFFMIFAPFEAGIGAFIMTTVGGVRPRLLRHRKNRPVGKLNQ